MDKKYIERPEKFDKSAYNSNYSKTHYKRFATDINPDLWENITDYCKDQNISKPEFLRRSLDALKELDK